MGSAWQTHLLIVDRLTRYSLDSEFAGQPVCPNKIIDIIIAIFYCGYNLNQKTHDSVIFLEYGRNNSRFHLN